jgi:hypothetical protein
MLELLVLLLLVLVTLGNLWCYLRGERGWASWLALACKLVAIAGTGALLWLVFRGKEIRERHEDEDGRQEIVVLEDHSLSMDLRGDAAGTPRAEYRDRVTKLVEELAEKDRSVVVRRFCFGGNVVPGEQARRVRRDDTRLGAAVEAVAARVGQGAVLVLSDGCVENEGMGGFGRKLAEERGVRFYSVACVRGDTEWQEAGLGEIDVDETNPERASVRAELVGVPPGEGMDVRWRLDGEERGASKLSRSGVAVCSLAETPPGWHEIEASIPVPPGDVCPMNNTRRGVFRVVGERRVAFVYGRADREQVEVARLLRQRLGDRLILVSEEDARTRALDADAISLLVVGHVAPQSFGPDLRSCLASKTTKVLYLGDRAMLSWPGAGDLFDGDSMEAKVLETPLPLRPAAGMRAFQAFDRLAVPVRRYLAARNRPDTAVLTVSGGTPAVLVADNPREPHTAALLLDDTWRWRLSHDAQSRAGFDTFWRLVLDWLLPEEQSDLELTAELAPMPDTAVRLELRASDELMAGLPPTLAAVIRGPGDMDERQVKMQLDGSQGVYVGETTYETPGEIQWVHAEARVNGRVYRALRVPIFREETVREHERPVPDVGVCRALATDPDRGGGTMEDAEQIVRNMLDRLPRAPELSRRERSFSREALLAGLVALALAVEWLLERVYLRRRPQD